LRFAEGFLGDGGISLDRIPREAEAGGGAEAKCSTEDDGAGAFDPVLLFEEL